ncbi:phd finger protein, putative [Plasmodium relictum]|uniref:Phd finger protein, putative n=1 Tax=Plasmodium relictum TaxID=85471 RepID=A0A1J1H5J3_PLARL|nr:phd finger protein, putative [Plasmodium relictum]CRG99827.1 phd finger protein, putative [Plasmodium relictum]
MDIKTTKKSYLDILKYYSKDEFRNEHIFHNIYEETNNNSYIKDESSTLNVNVELFFSLLFSNKTNYFYNIKNKYSNENVYKRDLEIHEEEKLITKLKKGKKKKAKNIKEQQLFLKNGYKKIESHFFSNTKNKTCTICLINNNSEYLERCKGCSLYFHAYCYKTFCDNFSLNNFICDICLESNNYNNSKNDIKSLYDNYNKYHFSYLKDDDMKEKINEVNISKKKEAYSYLKKVNKYISDNELNNNYRKLKKLKYLNKKKSFRNLLSNGYQSDTIFNRNFYLSEYYYNTDNVKIKKNKKLNGIITLDNFKNTSINYTYEQIKEFKEECGEEIKCSICERTNKNVLMKKKKKNLWFHLCCLYYNDITKNNSILHVYFEYFFFNHYNEDYFINLYNNLKSVNDTIIKKIKTELLNNYNILTNNHSFNFLLNPYYYNLTIKQIKNLIYYNFILNNNQINLNCFSLNSKLNYNTFYNNENDKEAHCNSIDNDTLKNINSCNFNFLHNDMSNMNKDSLLNNNINNKEFFQERKKEDKKKGNLTSVSDHNLQYYKDKNFIYCSDINNYNIINEENYFMNDLLYIANNHTKNEINLSIIKQNEYNNLFKEIEQLIYKRDFINLKILKQIKEKTIEVIKNNSNQICIFCKEFIGIKSKCMFPSCFTYFHVYCYYNKFLENCKKKKKLFIKNNIKESNFYIVKNINNKINIFQKYSKILKKKKHLHNYSTKINKDISYFNISNKESLHHKKKNIKNEDVLNKENNDLITINNNIYSKDVRKMHNHTIQKKLSNSKDYNSPQKTKNNNINENNILHNSKKEHNWYQNNCKKNQNEDELKLNYFDNSSYKDIFDKYNENLKKGGESCNAIINKKEECYNNKTYTDMKENKEKKEIMYINLKEKYNSNVGINKKKEKINNYLSSNKLCKKEWDLLIDKKNNTLGKLDNKNFNEFEKDIALENFNNKNYEKASLYWRKSLYRKKLGNETKYNLKKKSYDSFYNCKKILNDDRLSSIDLSLPNSNEKNIYVSKLDNLDEESSYVSSLFSSSTKYFSSSALTNKSSVRSLSSSSKSSYSSIHSSISPSSSSSSSFYSSSNYSNSYSYSSSSHPTSSSFVSCLSSVSSSSLYNFNDSYPSSCEDNFKYYKTKLQSSKLNNRYNDMKKTKDHERNEIKNVNYENEEENNNNFLSVGLLACNLENVNNNNVYINTIKLTMCPLHNNEKDIRTVMNLKMNTLGNKKYDNLNNIFYHYYNSFLHSLFFSNKYIHIMNEEEAEESENKERKDIKNQQYVKEQVEESKKNYDNVQENNYCINIENKKQACVNKRKYNIKYNYDKKKNNNINIENDNKNNNETNQKNDVETDKFSKKKKKKKLNNLFSYNIDKMKNNKQSNKIFKKNKNAKDEFNIKNSIQMLNSLKSEHEKNTINDVPYNRQILEKIEINTIKRKKSNKKEERKNTNDTKLSIRDFNNKNEETYGNSMTESYKEDHNSNKNEKEKKNQSLIKDKIEKENKNEKEEEEENKNENEKDKDLIYKINEFDEINKNDYEKLEYVKDDSINESNEKNLQSFIKYFDKIIENVETSSIIKNNICEGIYFLRQQNGLNIFQKFSGQFKKHLKIQNKKKKKKKKKKHLGDISILRKINVDIQKGNNKKNNNSDLKKKVNINKYSYLFYRLPLFIFGQKYVNDVDNLKSIYQIKNFFQQNCEFDTSANILSVIELLKNYANHKIFKKNVLSNKTPNDKEEKYKINNNNIKVSSDNENEITNLYNFKINSEYNNTATSCNNEKNSIKEKMNFDEIFYSSEKIKNNTYLNEDIDMNMENIENMFFLNKKMQNNSLNEIDLTIRDKKLTEMNTDVLNRKCFINSDNLKNNENNILNKIKFEYGKTLYAYNELNLNNKIKGKVNKLGDSNYNNCNDTHNTFASNKNKDIDHKNTKIVDDELCKGALSPNKSFNIVFTLFDNGNNIYLLIYESEKDNRKKFTKNKQLKKNEFNNIDYFFNELYNNLHLKNSNENINSILENIFFNNINNNYYSNNSEKLNNLKIDGTVLNKNILQNILKNFNLFSISRNTSIKLVSIFELTYYDYLFIKKHRFFYSKKGVKIYDNCNNLYEIKNNDNEVTEIKNDENEKLKKHFNLLSRELNKIINNNYKEDYNILNSKSIIANDNNIIDENVHLRDNKISNLSNITLHNLNSFEKKNSNVNIFQNTKVLNIDGNKNKNIRINKYTNENQKNANLNISYKNKILHKKISKNIYKKKNKHKKRNKKYFPIINNTFPLNSININNNDISNNTDFIINEYINNKTYDSDIKDYLNDIINIYNNFNIINGLENNNNIDENKLLLTNSFSNYDIYKLFLLDNTELKYFSNNEDKKKYLKDIFINKNILLNFKNSIVKKKQMEFLNENINNKNCEETNYNFLDINNILCFEDNKNKFLKKMSKDNFEELKTNNYIIKNEEEINNNDKIRNEEKINSNDEVRNEEEIKNIKTIDVYKELDKNKNANNWDTINSENFNLTNNKDIVNSLLNCYKTNDTLNILIKNNRTFNSNFIKENSNKLCDDSKNNVSNKILNHLKNNLKKEERKFYDYFNVNNCNENFNMLIDNSYEKIKNLYDNLNEEIIKNKIILISRIIEENHMYNLSDIPIYVNFVFYKYSCVNNWNNLIHNLRDSFLKEEAHFFNIKNNITTDDTKSSEIFLESSNNINTIRNEEMQSNCTFYNDNKTAKHINEEYKQHTSVSNINKYVNNNNENDECDNNNNNNDINISNISTIITTTNISTTKTNTATDAIDISNPHDDTNVVNYNKNNINETNEIANNLIINKNEAMHNAICSVCFNTEMNNINILYKCIGCSIYIHKYCYGIYQKNKNDDFLCDKCAISKFFKKKLQNEDLNKNIGNIKKKKKFNGNYNSNINKDNYNNKLNENDKDLDDNSNILCDNNKDLDDNFINKSFENLNCFICKKYGGALKKTTSKSFVHIFCVLFFISHVFCLNIYNLNYWNINNLNSFEDICCICNQRGFVINCCYNEHFEINNSNNTTNNSYIKNNKCSKYFHPLCAYLEGYHMKVEIYDDKFITTFFYDNCFSLFKIITYCNDHLPLDAYENRNEVKKKRNKYYINNECVSYFNCCEKILKKKDNNINRFNKVQSLHNKQNDNIASFINFNDTNIKKEKYNKNSSITNLDNSNENIQKNNLPIIFKNEHKYVQENYKIITKEYGNNEEHEKNKLDKIIKNNKEIDKKNTNYNNKNDDKNKIEKISKIHIDKNESNDIEIIKIIENDKNKHIINNVSFEKRNNEKNSEEKTNLFNVKDINVKSMNPFNKSDEIKCRVEKNNVSKKTITENLLIKNCSDNKNSLNICDKSNSYKHQTQESRIHETEGKLIDCDLLNNNKNSSTNLLNNTKMNSKILKENVISNKINNNCNELKDLKEKEMKIYDIDRIDDNIKTKDYLKNNNNNTLISQDKRNITNISNEKYTTQILNFIENKNKLENLSSQKNLLFKNIELKKEDLQKAHENYILDKDNNEKDNYKLKLKININDVYRSYKKLMKKKHVKYQVNGILKNIENCGITKSKKENKKSKYMSMKLKEENKEINNSYPNDSLSYNKNRKKIELAKNGNIQKKENMSYIEENVHDLIKSYNNYSYYQNLRNNVFSLYFIDRNVNDYKLVVCSACENLRSKFYSSQEKNNILNLLYTNTYFLQKKNKIKKSKKVYFFNYCHINDKRQEMLKLINFKMLMGCEKCSYFILEKNFFFHLIDKNYLSSCDDSLVVNTNLNMIQLYESKKNKENNKIHDSYIPNKNLREDEEKECFRKCLFEEKNNHSKNYASVYFFKNFCVEIFTHKFLLKKKLLFNDTILRYMIFHNKYSVKNKKHYFNTSIKRVDIKGSICNICKKKSYFLIKCSFEKCYKAFHISCINKKRQFHKFSIEFNIKNSYHIYCNSHCSNTNNFQIKLNLFLLLKVLLKLNNPLIEYIKNKFYKNNIFINYILNSKSLMNSMDVYREKSENKSLKEKLYSNKKGEHFIKTYSKEEINLSNNKQEISYAQNYLKSLKNIDNSVAFTNELNMNFRKKKLKLEENKIFKITKIKNKEKKIIIIFKFLQNLINRNSLFIKLLNDKYYKELKKSTVNNIILEKIEIFKLFLYSLIFSILYPRNMIFKIMDCSYRNILKNYDSVVYNFYYFILNNYKLIKKKYFQKVNIFNNFHSNITENLEEFNFDKFIENFFMKKVVNNIRKEKYKDINKLKKVNKNSSIKKKYTNKNFISNDDKNIENVNPNIDLKMKKKINKKTGLDLSTLKADKAYPDTLEKKKKIIEELNTFFIYEKRKKPSEPSFIFENYESRNKEFIKDSESCYLKESETKLKNRHNEKTKNENQHNYQNKEDIKENFTNLLFEDKIIKNEKISNQNYLLEKKKIEEKCMFLNECNKKKGSCYNGNDKEYKKNLNECNKKKINLNEFDKNKLILSENIKRKDEGNLKKLNKKKVKGLNGNNKKKENFNKIDKTKKRKFTENDNINISLFNENLKKKENLSENDTKENKVDGTLVNYYKEYNKELKFNSKNKIDQNSSYNKEKKAKSKNLHVDHNNSLSDFEYKNSLNPSNYVFMDTNIKYKKRKKSPLNNEKNNQKCEMPYLFKEKKKEILYKNSNIKPINCSNYNLQSSYSLKKKYLTINKEEKNKIKNEEINIEVNYKENNVKNEKYTHKNINCNSINTKNENTQEEIISKKKNDKELTIQKQISKNKYNKKKIFKLNYMKNSSKINTENTIMNTLTNRKKNKLNENHKKIEIIAKLDEENIKIDRYNDKSEETNNKDDKKDRKMDEINGKNNECTQFYKNNDKTDENSNEIHESNHNMNEICNKVNENNNIRNECYNTSEISFKSIEEDKDKNNDLKIKKKIVEKEFFLPDEKNEKKNFNKCIKNKYMKNEENNFIDILEYLEENTCNYKCYYKNIINTLHFNNDLSNDEYIEYILPLNDTKKVGINEKIIKRKTK